MASPLFLEVQKGKELAEGRKCALKLRDFKRLWNVQLRGRFGSADSKGLTKCDFEGGV